MVNSACSRSRQRAKSMSARDEVRHAARAHRVVVAGVERLVRPDPERVRVVLVRVRVQSPQVDELGRLGVQPHRAHHLKYAEPSTPTPRGPLEPLAAPSLAVPALILPTSEATREGSSRAARSRSACECTRWYRWAASGRDQRERRGRGRAGVGGRRIPPAGVVAAFIFGRFDAPADRASAASPAGVRGRRGGCSRGSRQGRPRATEGSGEGMRTLAPPSPNGFVGTIERAASWSERVP